MKYLQQQTKPTDMTAVPKESSLVTVAVQFAIMC